MCIRTEVPEEVGPTESSGILFLKTFESWRSLSVEYTIAALKPREGSDCY